MARWKIKKARYPVDPSKAWIAYRGSIIHAHRFPTWRQAQNFVAGKETRQIAKQQKRIDRDQGIRP